MTKIISKTAPLISFIIFDIRWISTSCSFMLGFFKAHKKNGFSYKTCSRKIRKMPDVKDCSDGCVPPPRIGLSPLAEVDLNMKTSETLLS